MESILVTLRKLSGIGAEYTHFDLDIITYANSVFAILAQAGVGPSEGFSISDDTAVWEDFLPEGGITLLMAKTYVQLKTKLMFDPPVNSSHLQALKESIAEYEWRLNVAADSSNEG